MTDYIHDDNTQIKAQAAALTYLMERRTPDMIERLATNYNIDRDTAALMIHAIDHYEGQRENVENIITETIKREIDKFSA